MKKLLFLAILLVLGGAIVISSCSRSSPSFVNKSPSTPPTAKRYSGGSLFSLGAVRPSSITVPVPTASIFDDEVDPDVQAGIVFSNLDFTALTLRNTTETLQPELERKAEAPRNTVAVVVENLSVVRDKGVQGGFSQADVVFEALVEGGITRFLLILSNGLPKGDYRLRPVRSSRSYFVSWALPFGNYVYFGTAASTQDRRVDAQGMAEELERQDLLHRLHMDDTGRVFARDNSLKVATEHTLYTSTRKLLAELKRRNWFDVNPQGQSFLPKKPEAELAARGADGQVIRVGFDGAYSVEWTYNRKENAYYRKQGGKVHIDYQLDEISGVVNKIPITAKNIVIQFCQVQPSAQTGDARVVYQTTGEGAAWFLLDGHLIKGRWHREAVEDVKFNRAENSDQAKFASFSTQPFEYVDGDSNRIYFNPGQTWVEMVTQETKIIINLGE